MCTVLLPPDVNPIAVDKHINININLIASSRHIFRATHMLISSTGILPASCPMLYWVDMLDAQLLLKPLLILH
jgi:hypothetical protein